MTHIHTNGYIYTYSLARYTLELMRYTHGYIHASVSTCTQEDMHVPLQQGPAPVASLRLAKLSQLMTTWCCTALRLLSETCIGKKV